MSLCAKSIPVFQSILWTIFRILKTLINPFGTKSVYIFISYLFGAYAPRSKIKGFSQNHNLLFRKTPNALHPLKPASSTDMSDFWVNLSSSFTAASNITDNLPSTLGCRGGLTSPPPKWWGRAWIKLLPGGSQGDVSRQLRLGGQAAGGQTGIAFPPSAGC